MPVTGDRVRVASTKVDQVPRDGVVTGVIGQMLRIKWSTGEESMVVPGPGAFAVIGKARTSSDKTDPAVAKGAKAMKPVKTTK